MKLLFYNVGADGGYNRPDWICDYQQDSLLHGLKSILSPDELVDHPKAEHLYQTYPHNMGRRFSLYKLLPDEYICRADLKSKIKNRYFDKIILAFHHSTNGQWWKWQQYISTMLIHYPPERLVVLNGWDLPHYHTGVVNSVKYYFQREIVDNNPKILPIQFGIPKEKLRSPHPKLRAFAPHIPSMFSWENCPHTKTYNYDNEEDFYDDYQRSMFGYHCKKGGWDTMKGLEILAGACMPVWLDQQECPSETLKFYPKELLSHVRELPGVDWGLIDKSKYVCDTRNIREGGGAINEDRFDFDSYHELLFDLLEYTKTHLTTEALGRRFLDEITA